MDKENTRKSMKTQFDYPVMISAFFYGPPISDRDFQQWALGWKHSSFRHSKGTSREMPWKASIGFRQIGTSSRCFCHNQKSGDSQAFQAFSTIFSSEINMKSAESCWMYPSDSAKDASSELSGAGVALCHCPKTWPSRVLENSWHWGHGLRSLGNRLVEYCNIFIIDTVWYDII